MKKMFKSLTFVRSNVQKSVQKSVVAPPPIVIKSSSSPLSKVSLLSFSFVLAPLLLTPFSVVKAATTSCSTTSSTACISGTGYGGVSVSFGDTLDSTPDVKTLKLQLSSGALNNPDRYFSVTANSSILTASNFTVDNGSKTTFNFKNSAYKGNFTMARNGGFNSVSSFSFDGSYQGNSDNSVKGYAYVGNITVANQTFKGVFKNDANMKGDIITTQPWTYQATTNVTFTNSSLEGSIVNKRTDDTGRVTTGSTVSFSGNSSKGFAMKGNINNSYQSMNVNFSNGAKMIGNIISKTDAYRNALTTSVSFNNSSLDGNINATGNYGTLSITATNGSKLNTNLTGTNGGFTDTINLTLDNSTLQGRKDNSITSYTNTNDNFSLKATGGSKIYMNLTTDGTGGSNNIHPSSVINLKDSEWTGSIQVGANASKVTLNLNASSMNGNVSGDGIFASTLTDASIGNITNNNASSTLTFASVATSGQASDHTIGNINFSGKITGSIGNTTIGNIALNSSNKISSDLALKNSSLNHLRLYNGANLKFSAVGTTIGSVGNKGSAIENRWGTLDATFDSTTVNGNITWGDSTFINSVSKDKGLYFTNKSILNGDIIADDTGNNATYNTFSFDNSSMNGNINLRKKKNGQENAVTVNFTGNSAFSGDITGDSIIWANFDTGTIIKSNTISNANVNSTLKFTGVKDSSIVNIDFSGVITGDLSHSDIGNLNNGATSSSLSLSNQKTDTSLNQDADASSPINILGDVTFAGTLNIDYHNSVAKSLSLSGTSNLSFSDTSNVGALNVSGGQSTLNLINQSTLGALNVSDGNSTVNLKSGSLVLSTIGVTSKTATSSVSFSSALSGDGSIDFTKSNEMLKQKLADLAKTAPNAPEDEPTTVVSSAVDNEPTDSSNAPSDPDSNSSISSLTPQEILSYLSQSNISSYAGNILTTEGQNNVDFHDSLYLGGNVNTTGGTANVTLSFSDAFISKLQANDFTNKLLYGGDGPLFVVTTNGQNAVNNIALSGSVKGVAQFNYLKGETNIVFADSISKNADGSDVAFSGGDSTDFGDINVFDPNSTDASKKQVKVNGLTYQSGIYLNLDSAKADEILKNYRDIFPINSTTFKIDKVSSSDIYTANIYGVMVGEVSSLVPATGVSTATTYEAIFKDDAVFIGKLNITDKNIHIHLSQGSKLILEDGSNIGLLSSAPLADGSKESFILNDKGLTGDSLYQENTIIDLATGGIPSASSNLKTSFATLNIGEVKDLNNAVFRLSYNPFSNASDDQKRKGDHLIINSASKGNQVDYIQAYQNSLSPVLGDLSDKNILVASIKNDATDSDGNKTAGLAFNSQSTVLQGYDLITTTFDKKIQNSNLGDDASASAGGDTWTNYYIGSARAQITQTSQNLTQAAITSNYSIFLANINDLNKRLGELRDNTNAQGVWGRIFNGMTTSNRGQEVKTYSTNVQAGYDFSIPNSSLDGKTYLGLALSYGYNKLGGQTFDGKANLIELGAYYSYVGNTGFYNDMILKYSFISNDLSVQNNENKDTSFNSSTASLGEELGYRFYFNLKETQTSRHRLYLEPSAEFIFGYVGNGGFDQINGNAFLDAAIDNILAFRGRVGGVLGYSLNTAHNQTDFRVGLSYVTDIVGGGNINFKSNFSTADLNIQSNQMALVSVGVNSILSDRWKVYADVETSFGGTYYNQNYLVSVGGRYAFGKKTMFAQNNQSHASTQETMANTIKEGYYFDVYTMAKNGNLSKEQMTLLSKYPYVISIENEKFIDPKTKNQRTIEVKKILIGPFKTKEGAQKSESIADEIAKILNKKETKALLKEVN
ncbi:hypothetical protein BKH42_00905 [Helicobacter sp. 13S00482-2]|uniref:autotransporter outer membrane beta-barrel domain-containing protein n=1 Tax=Helicobacter sp. 13S00482-2 TaxID=1476200 RepID=UPI000BA7B25F|nr:autotransporter outer membrane beta-barrel domain-containing protein [Helicobacter sp. 13S00482-2]PAF54500.1 hypothetical protein BKH42_00905 [Helicobacter sp. 13S00482-2]